MTEVVAVVGSREGADLDHVERFCLALYERQPDTILISGGAKGVDSTAERVWPGAVSSYRPKQKGPDHFVIERWDGHAGRFTMIVELVEEPSFLNFKSAAIYRDMLVAEEADRVVAFYRPGRSRGTAFTEETAREAEKKPTYTFERSTDGE